ncbi:hypothetical protein ACFO7V_00740 [Glutamicibacter bergerei]|uniref:Uncharacterized protein n=1 Tax=Glutamicibacter bergerei TaxID=256702 RepID=A0ABV9MFU4_9MICC|nr:hypothetical protein [Micrococcaceae bacterium]
MKKLFADSHPVAVTQFNAPDGYGRLLFDGAESAGSATDGQRVDCVNGIALGARRFRLAWLCR